MKNQSGMTLVEVIVVMAMLTILMTIATFAFGPILSGSQYKEASRNVVSALRDARSRAITENKAYSAVFDLDGKSIWLADDGGNIEREYAGFAETVGMRLGADCTSVTSGDGNLVAAGDTDTDNGELVVTFNGNGTCSATTNGSATADTDIYVCALDATGKRKYHSGVQSTVSGKVIVEKRNAADTAWE